jgi:hypothetical protein
MSYAVELVTHNETQLAGKVEGPTRKSGQNPSTMAFGWPTEECRAVRYQRPIGDGCECA